MTAIEIEHARMTDEIAQLRRELEVASRRLVRARSVGPSPRGFGVGLAVGAAVIVACVCAMSVAFAAFMSHYG